MTDAPRYVCAECGAEVHVDQDTLVLTRDCAEDHEGKGVILELGDVALVGVGAAGG